MSKTEYLFIGVTAAVVILSLGTLVVAVNRDADAAESCALKGGQMIRLPGAGRVCAKLEVLR